VCYEKGRGMCQLLSSGLILGWEGFHCVKSLSGCLTLHKQVEYGSRDVPLWVGGWRGGVVVGETIFGVGGTDVGGL
jgi:hypothetical protein